MVRIQRFFSSLTTRLQITTLLVSVIGIFFSYRSYYTLKDKLPEVSEVLMFDLQLQIVIALLAQVLAWLIISGLVIKPLVTLVEMMRQLGEGKYDAEVPYVTMSNQMGSFARKVKVFKDRVTYMRRLEDERQGIKERMDAERHDLFSALAKRFDDKVNHIVQQFHVSTSVVQGNAEGLSQIAHSNTRLLSKLKEQSKQSSDTMHGVASSAEELAASIQQISEQVARASGVTQEAVAKASAANQTMQALSAQTSKISEVLSMIGEITEQINLLALNATIEAARAGEQGRGFSVVASEVKSLAGQTAVATKEIAQFITHIAQQAKTAGASISEIHGTITEVNAIAGSVANAVSAQDAATRHIAKNILASANLVSEGSRVVDESSSATGEVQEASEEMLEVCSKLGGQAAGLHKEVQEFLATLKQS